MALWAGDGGIVKKRLEPWPENNLQGRVSQKPSMSSYGDVAKQKYTLYLENIEEFQYDIAQILDLSK